MKKNLLALCAGVLALGVSAQNFNAGEAFTYNIGPDFKWFDNNEEFYQQNDNWPAAALQAQASMADGYGLAMFWFAQYNSGVAGPVADTNTLEEAQAILPVVGDPWNESGYAIQVQAPSWWAYGNLNFALPQVGELCRIRAIYRVDIDGYDKSEPAKPFHVRLYDTPEQDAARAVVEEAVASYWDNPGYRVVDIYHELAADNFYLALTFDGAGLTCGGNKPAFYLQEISVVPVKNLAGDTHVTGDTNYEVTDVCPELVTVGDEGSISEVAVSEKVAGGIYDLQGRKVAKAAHGLYIINGVKTFVK